MHFTTANVLDELLTQIDRASGGYLSVRPSICSFIRSPRTFTEKSVCARVLLLSRGLKTPSELSPTSMLSRRPRVAWICMRIPSCLQRVSGKRSLPIAASDTDIFSKPLKRHPRPKRASSRLVAPRRAQAPNKPVGRAISPSPELREIENSARYATNVASELYHSDIRR